MICILLIVSEQYDFGETSTLNYDDDDDLEQMPLDPRQYTLDPTVAATVILH